MDLPDLCKIKELRSRVEFEISKYSPAYSDYSLHRWLLNYNNNLEEIVPKLRFHLRNRQLLNLDDPDLIDKLLNPRDKLGCNNLFFLPFINSPDSFARDGGLVSFAHLGLGSSSCFKHMSVREIITHQLRGSEVGTRLLEKNAEKKEGRVPFITTVLDLEGIGGHIHTYIRESRNIVPEVVRNYPAVSGRMIFVNCPLLIDMVGRFLKSFFSHYCEIIFIGQHNTRKNLLKYISEENLPEYYGGTLKNCLIDYGICRSLPFEPIERPLVPETLLNIWLKPNSPVSLCFYAEANDKWIFWWFQTDGDVELAIYHGESADLDNLIIPPFCVSTQHIPDSGTIATLGPGVYTIVFNCPYSRLLKTKLNYFIELQK